MDNPSEQPDRKSKPEAAPERANFWPPILFVGGLFIAGYVLSEIDKELLGEASEIVRWVVGLAIVAFVTWLLVGKTLDDIAKGTKALIKGAAILIAVVIIFGPLTKCSSDESRTPTELYYRR